MKQEFQNKILFFFPILLFAIFLNIYHEDEIYKLSNTMTVVSVFILTLSIVSKKIFTFNKNSNIVYFFIIICLISCFFSQNFLSSIKRFIIVFVPFVIIFQVFSNISNVKDVKDKFEKLFIIFVLSYNSNWPCLRIVTII